MDEKRCPGCMKKKTQIICEHCGYDERTENAIHQLPVGTVLKEQYQIGRVLGQGGFGITYLGWDLYLSMPVAIKEYYPAGMVMREATTSMDVYNCTGDDGARFRNNKERFLREAKMLARFSQVPQVVQVKNFFLANNTAYIVMEYVDGINLKNYVKRKGGKLSVQETFDILRPIIETLCRIHKSELVHRDISPDNIMMLPDGSAKLLDFGAVRDLSKEASTQIVLKQGYAPLEQYQQHGNLGPWTDVYALCATIYYCLTGKTPSDAPERLLGDENLRWRELVPELTSGQLAALEHGMELRVENRTPSMDALYDELFCRKDVKTILDSVTQNEKTNEKSDADEKKTVAVKTESRKEKKKEQSPKKPVIIPILAVAVAIVIGVMFLVPRKSAGDAAEPVQTQQDVQSGSCGAELSWVLESETGILTISGTGAMDDYGKTDHFAPWKEFAVTGIVLEDGVTSVGDYAFFGMESITSLQFSNTLENVGSHAFWNCQIPELSFPESLKVIEESAFSFNPVVEVEIPNSVAYLDKGCFDGCASLKTVTLGPDTRLNYDIWYGPMFGHGGSGITLRGYSNTMVEDYARIWNYYFESTGKNEWDLVGTEPSGNNAGKWYFDADTGFLLINGCTMLDSYLSTDPEDPKAYVTHSQVPGWMEVREQIITVSFDEVYGIGSYTFAHCVNLTDVNFDEALGHIGAGAFMDTNLDEVNFSTLSHDGNGQIHEYAFSECRNLREVVLHDSFEKINKYAFSGCSELERFYAEMYFDNFHDENSYPIFTSAEYPELPENLTVYGLRGGREEASAQSHGIKFATGLWGMTAEEEGQCGENTWWFKSGDTLVISGHNDRMWNYKTDLVQKQLDESKKVSNLAPSDEPEYKQYASEIRNLIILPGQSSIGSGAFMGMSALENVTIEAFDNLDISDHAFADCDNLRMITIPYFTVALEEYAFADCDNLAKVYLRGGKSISPYVFANCPNLEGIWFFGTSHHLYGEILGDSYSENIVFHAKPGHTNVFSWVKNHGVQWSGEFLY